MPQQQKIPRQGYTSSSTAHYQILGWFEHRLWKTGLNTYGRKQFPVIPQCRQKAQRLPKERRPRLRVKDKFASTCKEKFGHTLGQTESRSWLPSPGYFGLFLVFLGGSEGGGFLSFYLIGIVNDNLHLAGKYTAIHTTVIWNWSEWKYTSMRTVIGKRTLIQNKGKEVWEPWSG